jgi:hypothetical protein
VERQTECYVVFMTFEDFFDFHIQLLGHFPAEAGINSSSRIIPDIPGQVMFVSESLALERKRMLTDYLKVLLPRGIIQL